MGLVSFIKEKLGRGDPRQQLKKAIKEFELPYFPRAALYILEGLRDPNVPNFEIAKRVAADPGIHLRILKTINSAAFGLSHKVTNIEHAVALLGRARLESLILPLAVKDTLPPLKSQCLNQRLFWLGSARRGSLARQIAQQLHPTTHTESFSAGLLQDMAIPVIIKFKEKTYCPTLETWNSDREINLEELEIETLGFDHQDIGALMAMEWNLPEYLVSAISSHHRYEESQDPAVYLVSHLRYVEDPSQSPEMEIVVEEAYEKFSLPKDTTKEMVERAYQEAEELAQVFL